MFLKPLRQIFVRPKNFCTCVLSEMYTSMEGSCYIENLQFFSNFQWGFKDKDMVCLNVCPLVNSMGQIANSVLRYSYMKWNDKTSQLIVELSLDWLKSVICSWQQMWANILAHHFSSVRPKCFRERGRQWLSPSMSAAWVIQESYSQVKLWPFNGTYCKGICWSLSRDTNSFICHGTRSVFAQVGHSM